MDLTTRYNFAHSLGEPSALPQRGSPFSSSTRPVDDRGRLFGGAPVIDSGIGMLESWVGSLTARRSASIYRRLSRASAAPDDLPAESRRRVRRRAMAAGLFLLCADEHGLSPLELHALLDRPRHDTCAALTALRRRVRRSA
ncbi:MAG: hypothetical protein KDA22_13315 [Phycisphaerales bacterium]|nr:hypothetical protein [Phycisphaerales bacterium]